MISDAYTIEYDRKQLAKESMRNYNRIVDVVQRFGCDVIIKVHADRTNVNIMLPNGKLFHRFNSFEKALEWAGRWEQKKQINNEE